MKYLANLNAIAIKKVNLDDNFQPKVDDILNRMQIAIVNYFLFVLQITHQETVLNRKPLKNWLSNFKGIVVIDEAYIDFSNEKSWITSITGISKFNCHANPIKSICDGRNSLRNLLCFNRNYFGFK